MSIKILRWKPYNKPPTLGFVDILVEGWKLEIRGLTVFQKDGKRNFSLPSKPYQNEAGETKYMSYVGFTEKEWYAKFMQGVEFAFDEFCKEEARKAEEAARPQVQTQSSDEELLPF